MSLTVTVLGSSGTYAGVDGACTGFLVRSAGATVMMDAGPGTLANLQRHVRPDQLDAVVLSHCHPDHWLELPVLRNALKYVLAHHGVQLFCTVETLDMADALGYRPREPMAESPAAKLTVTGGDGLRLETLLPTATYDAAVAHLRSR